jgi:hypothetical protein
MLISPAVARDRALPLKELATLDASLGDLPDWISTVAKVSPILSGVAAFGGFISGVIAARQSAAFQQELMDALQAIQSDLAGIESELDQIYAELKNIETDIEGLGLNDKLTAIETWGQEMGALEPGDTTGAKNLATAMMDASQGATNLLGCMNGLHNAMVGEDIGTPLIHLVDAPSFLRLRARLAQGLQLLAFGCAFNTQETYDYGVFLLNWSANFDQQNRVYFSSGKDYVPLPDLFEVQLLGGDTVAVFQYAQTSLDNVALVVQGDHAEIPVYCGRLGWSIPSGYNSPMLGFPSGPHTAYLDLANDESTTDPNSPLSHNCNPFADLNRWLWASLQVLSGLIMNVLAAKGKLVCAARVTPGQTFLGAVNGQLAWIAAAGQTTYTCGIHDGGSVSDSLLAYDASARTVSSIPFTGLASLAPALWVVSWVSQGVVSISPQGVPSSSPAYLTVDSSGNWAISSTASNLEVAAFSATSGSMGNPYLMAPTPATIRPSSGPTKTALFQQL